MPNQHSSHFTSQQREAITRLLTRLIDQNSVHVLVEPQAAKTGFWFGGGNLARDDHGALWLSGRFRNFGDSRTGLQAGERGLEIAVYRSDDNGQTFQKISSWSKTDLSRPQAAILSYEGTSLHRKNDGTWELFVSSEKDASYPPAVAEFQKPGTGVWSVDVMTGPSPDALDPTTFAPALANHDFPQYLHIKDPVIYDAGDGLVHMLFCSHPFSWTSSNTGLATRAAGDSAFQVASWEIVSRGAAWDVAATRITSRMPIPQTGVFADSPPASVYFYDGAECLRSHEENVRAVSRPRGHSCEEIGGAFIGLDRDFSTLERLSMLHPLFVSPWGTGASRYVDVLEMEEGWLATWEQGQSNGSQPLVAHFLDRNTVEQILSG
jgi:hypothetical protein